MVKKKKPQPKIKPKNIRDEYPSHPIWCPVKPIRERNGCKVHWFIFPTEELARECQKWALVECEIRERQGYDSGYCSPGSIAKVEDGFEVCIL